MTPKKRFAGCATLVGLVVLTVGAGSAPGAKTTTLDHQALCGAGNTFTANVTNPYFPLPKKRVVVFTGKDQGQTISVRMTVKGTFAVGSVTTRVLEEFEWSDPNGDGVLNSGDTPIEISQNYFAQTTAGTVCYFGEDVLFFETGSTDGTWHASDQGSFAGIFMPASPTVGQRFQQEGDPGVAEDIATIVHSGALKIGKCTFPDTIRVEETNPIDAGKGFKTYARGVGMIRDGGLDIRLGANCLPA